LGRRAAAPGFGLLAALGFGALTAAPLSGQLVSASTAGLGMAGNNGALARGVAALGTNPANLGFWDNPGWTMVFPVVGARQGLSPVSLSDIADYEGRLIPDSQKEEWLREIEAEGGQNGLGALELALVGFSVRNVAFQVHTQGFGDANLNPEAAELLMFGNAGRTGSPRDFSLDGSSATTSGITTFAGGTLTYSVGNFVGLARDAGSEVTSDPIEVDVAFPVIHSDTDEYDLSQGTGFGLDIGAAWLSGPLTLGATLHNVVHTFEFSTDGMVYRPLDIVFTEDGSSTDTDKRPIEEAPQFMLDELAALKFKPRLRLASAYEALDNLTFTADFVQRFGDGLPAGAKTRLGVGMDWRAIDAISVQVGAGYVTGGYTAGFGSALTFGAFNLGGAFQLQRGDIGDASLVALGIGFNTR
jgi:hypothetical protein